MTDKSQIIMDNSTVSNPDITIAIPTFGRADYLEEAIDSALNQKNAKCKYEVMVVSNDPNDSLDQISEKYRGYDNIRIFRNNENIGMVRNANRCVELARGRYVAFLHDDDFLLDNYLSILDQYLFKESDIDCFIPGRYIYFEGECIELQNAKKKKILRDFYFIPNLYRKKVRELSLIDVLKCDNNCYFSPSCGTAFLKESFLKIGGFNNSIPYSWDYDFFLRLNLKSKVVTCSEMCAVYRMSANASMRSEVKYDFFDYKRKQYLSFMLDNHIDDSFVRKYREEIIYRMYSQWPNEIKAELESRNEKPIEINKNKWKWFKFITLLYYYNHNLDIQRLGNGIIDKTGVEK